MSKLLVCDRRGDIHSLLRRRFAQDGISIESVGCMGSLLDRVARGAYDIIVWDGDVSKSERAKGAETLQALAKSSPDTQIMIV
ncbi:MAG TPA: hypothetical protein VEG60_33875, partial [Candidatus Binatia bacterium]|nr:hypothetical protein [Candidatus Binatia bacterium]